MVCYDRNDNTGLWDFKWKRKLNHWVPNMSAVVNYSPMNEATPAVVCQVEDFGAATEDFGRPCTIATPESLGTLLLCADNGSRGITYNGRNGDALPWFPIESWYALDPEHPMAHDEITTFLTESGFVTDLTWPTGTHRSQHVFGSAAIANRDFSADVQYPGGDHKNRWFYYPGCNENAPGVLYGVKAACPIVGTDGIYYDQYNNPHPTNPIPFIPDNETHNDPEQCWARYLTNIGPIAEGNSTSTPVTLPREGSGSPYDVYIIVTDAFHNEHGAKPTGVLAKFDGSGLTLTTGPDYGMMGYSVPFPWYRWDASGRPSIVSPVYADLGELGKRIFVSAPDGIRVFNAAAFSGANVGPVLNILPTAWNPQNPVWQITSQPVIYKQGGTCWVFYVESLVSNDQVWHLVAYPYPGGTPWISTPIATTETCSTQPYYEDNELWIAADNKLYRWDFVPAGTSNTVVDYIGPSSRVGSYCHSSCSFPQCADDQYGYFGGRDGKIYQFGL